MSRYGTYDLKYGFIPDDDGPIQRKEEAMMTKPCPFCGGKAMIWLSKHDGKLGRVIECDKCHIRVSFPWASIDAQAIDDWNRRSDNG